MTFADTAFLLLQPHMMEPKIEKIRLSKIPVQLRIRVLYVDERIVVIEKPHNLRSVAGNAAAGSNKRPREEEQKKTAQEAWIAALESFQEDSGDDETHKWVKKLANSPSLVSIPRKLKPFLRYCKKNQYRLVPEGEPRLSNSDLENLGTNMQGVIEGRQRSLLNLPEATKHEESAFGQLILMGYATEERPLNLFAVHRLDCETSGVMVFARTKEAASFLGKAWRERDQVSKTYVARVKRWPPYSSDKKQLEGTIELPLVSSDERLKWKVDENGKPSTTLWKIRKADEDVITLELTPVTGRTHQLRIHLAEIGSGIEGDTLYGDHPEIWDPNNPKGNRLCLHAENLCFPHPETGELMEFSCELSW